MSTAENKLKNLFREFDIYFFDPDEDKSGIVSQIADGKTPTEIDAIAIKNNILILINIYSGFQLQQGEYKLGAFFRDLGYFTKAEQLNLVVANVKTPRGIENLNYISEIKGKIFPLKFKWVVLKLAFYPNVYIPKEKNSGLNEREKIIDKKHYDYFEYGLEVIPYEHIERELFYFLGIKYREINRPISSRIEDAELTGKTPVIEVNVGVSQKMFSGCVTVNDILPYTQVIRIAEQYNVRAFQRMINKETIRKISEEYLNSHDSFPNNIILAFNPELYKITNLSDFIVEENGNKYLKFYKEFGSLIVIDGQHRLLAHLINPNRDLNKHILINVILFCDVTKAYDEMAGLFYLINTKQKKLASLVSLTIRSKINPEDIESVWYKIFENLNERNERNNFLFGKISFEEPELRQEKDKLNMSSIILYSGIKRITRGVKKKGRTFIGLQKLSEGIISEELLINKFYENFIRNFFSIIGEILQTSGSVLAPRDIGGLLRILIHFINYRSTKNLFKELSREQAGIPANLKERIKKYISLIPFDRLSDLEYSANSWAVLEGFFISCIRKKYKKFGFESLLSKKGIKALKRRGRT